MKKGDMSVFLVFAVLVTIAIVIYILVKLSGLSDPVPVLKDGSAEVPREPQTVYMTMIAKAETAPIVKEAEPLVYIPDQIIHHELDQHDIKILARLLWSSPLRDISEKRKLLWVVFNRMDDASGLFGDTVSSVVIKNEFRFYDPKSYISKENLKIVEEEFDRYLSMWDGLHINRPIPKEHVYCDFANYSVHTYSTITRAAVKEEQS